MCDSLSLDEQFDFALVGFFAFAGGPELNQIPYMGGDGGAVFPKHK